MATEYGTRDATHRERAVANAFLGTSEFAATVLERLAGSAHRPALVVTPPDRPRGRGRRLGSPPAAERARELGIELHQTASVNQPDSRERLRASDAELCTVCAFGQLIGEPLLSELPMLNVHPSLLPRWRGAAPIERAIIAGDSRTGVSVMRVTAGLDSGPVALAEELPIEPADTHGTLAPRLAELGGELLVRALDLHAAGELELTEQDDAEATYAEKIEATDRWLDPERPADELARIVRALTPHVGAFVALSGGGRLGVCRVAPITDGPEAGRFEAEGDRLLLGCADGALELIELKPPGKRAMPAADYLHGHRPPERVLPPEAPSGPDS